MKINYTVTIDKINDIISFKSNEKDAQSYTTCVNKCFKLGEIKYMVTKLGYTYKLIQLNTGDGFRLYNNLKIILQTKIGGDLKMTGIRKSKDRLEKILELNNIGYNKLKKVENKVRTINMNLSFTDGQKIENDEGYCIFSDFNWIILAKYSSLGCDINNILVNESIYDNDKALNELNYKLSKLINTKNQQSDNFMFINNKSQEFEEILNEKMKFSIEEIRNLITYIRHEQTYKYTIKMRDIYDDTVVTNCKILQLKNGEFELDAMRCVIRYAKKIDNTDNSIPTYKLANIVIDIDKFNSELLYLLEHELFKHDNLQIYNKELDTNYYTTD